MSVDFEVTDRVRVDSSQGVVDALADIDGPVRVAGNATNQDRVPAPHVPVTLLELGGMDRIVRLDPGDLTCSVEPGVTRDALDAALAEHRLCLPIEDSGSSLGGIFARGEHAAASPAAHSTRSLILGIEAVLGEGKRFKAGASVVKSVAGFDLQRAFVGSRGRLFVTTQIHLKLRPRPEHEVWFCERGLDAERAVDRFRTLRRLADPPAALYMTRGAEDGYTVSGRIAGRRAVVDAILRSLELDADEAPAHSDTPQDFDRVVGIATPADIAAVLRATGDHAVTFNGSCQFALDAEADAIDTALDALAELGLRAELTRADAARRGRHVNTDARSRALGDELEIALDPHRRLR